MGISFGQNDRLNYLNQGGGALQVLFKRNIMCYFSSVLRLRLLKINAVSNDQNDILT